MTCEEMAADARAAIAAGTRMSLVHARSLKMPPKWPRGELLCENHDGRNVYSYDPARILALLIATMGDV